MKTIIALVSVLASTAAIAGPDLQICRGEYALCAASSAEPTGSSIVVNGNTFREGVSVCPVLKGEAIADLNLMNGSCKAAKGKVWSLFSNVKNFPQAPTWAVKPEVVRTFTTTATPGGGMSNMWSFPCTKRKNLVNGVQLADCYGPLNESPWTSTSVPVGSVVGTAAAVGASNPVGGNIP
jgi:hypothetical protein